MPDPITRLNAALEGRYRIERELGQGCVRPAWVISVMKRSPVLTV